MFSVFKNLNKFAGRSKLFDVFAVFCARYLAYFMVFFLLFFFVWQKNLPFLAYALLSAFFARFIINELVYLFYKKQRPAQLGIAKVLIPVPKYSSFPSGHASFFFAISFYLFFYNVPLAWVFLFLSLIMGAARVFCGVHWFKDILAGMAVGAVTSLIFGFFSLV